MDGKFLGKIKDIYFGMNEGQTGLFISLGSSSGVGTFTSNSVWDPIDIEPDENHKWTNKDRDKRIAEIFKRMSRLMHDAKVKKLDDLKNIPVEMTFEGNILKEWRILAEVI